MSSVESLKKLLVTMQTLREKCPWDRKQTPLTLTKYAIEEAYELEAAIRSGDLNEIKNELGDLLLQVVFQSQIYAEQDAFTFDDVAEAIHEKMIRRHPHVFDAHPQELSDQALSDSWQTIKQKEKKDHGQSISILDQVKHGPTLNQAEQVQKQAASIGFDFSTLDDSMSKFQEEWGELNEAISLKNTVNIEKEFGDCLFSLVNVGRHLGLSSDQALALTIHKFRTRFMFIEQAAYQKDQSIADLTAHQMDVLWEQAKLLEAK